MIVAHRAGWADDFAREAARLRRALGPSARAVHHIGSTAVPGLAAVPIIDIMVEAHAMPALAARTAALEALGYEALGAHGIAGRLYFRRIVGGQRTHHLHAFAVGSHHVRRHLAVRAYLAAHPATAARYAALKLALVRRGASWQGYGEGKASFVDELERQALAWDALRGAR